MRTRWIAVAALALLAGVTATAQVTRQEMAGINNFSRVDATVGCGGATAPEAMAGLKREGFAAVINLRQASEPGADVEAGKAAAEAAGLTYIHLPFNGGSPDPAVADAFLAAVSAPANQPVYVHCASANRVGALWMIKRVLQDGWAIERARTEAQAIGLASARLDEFAVTYINAHR